MRHYILVSLLLMGCGGGPTDRPATAGATSSPSPAVEKTPEIAVDSIVQEASSRLESSLHFSVFQVKIGKKLAEAVESNPDFLARVKQLRKELHQEWGFPMPGVRFRGDSSLKPDEYVVWVREQEVARGRLELSNPSTARVHGPAEEMETVLRKLAIQHAADLYGRQAMLGDVHPGLRQRLLLNNPAQDLTLQNCKKTLREKKPLKVDEVAKAALEQRPPSATSMPSGEIPPAVGLEQLVDLQVFEVRLGSALAAQKPTFEKRALSVRQYLADELGWVMPGISFVSDPAIAPQEYRVLVQGTPALKTRLRPNALLAIGNQQQLAGLKGESTVDPTYGLSARWISPADQKEAERVGCIVFDPVSVWGTQMTELGRERCAEFFSATHLQASLSILGPAQDALVLRLVADPGKLQTLQKVIQNLLADRVPVRDLELLGELVLNSNSSDADRLSESARLLLAPNILSNLDVEGTVYVVRLGPRLNAALAGQPNKAAVLGRVKQAVEALKGQRRQPVLVASPQARRALRRLSAREYPDLVVLSSSEMLPPYRFKTLRVVDLP